MAPGSAGARRQDRRTTVIKSKDAWFTARVPARIVGEIVKEQDSYTVTIDIGSDAPIYCEVMPEGFDMADMLRRTLEQTVTLLEKARGKVEARQLESSDAGVIGNVPYLQTSWLYRVNDGKEDQLGALKQMAFEKFGHGVYCAHLDIGYVKTFDTVMRSLAESFQAPPVAPPPYYLDIGIASLAGKKVGITIARLERDADGDTKASQLTALLFTAPGGKLTTQDALHVEWVKPDGALMSASHSISTDGKIVTDVDLKHSTRGWLIQGESAGQKLEEQLAADAQPASWLEQATVLRKVCASGNPIGVEQTTSMWIAADLVKLTDAKTKVLAKKGPNEYNIRVTAGTLVGDAVLDASTGMPTSQDITLGNDTLHVERIYVSGSF